MKFKQVAYNVIKSNNDSVVTQGVDYTHTKYINDKIQRRVVDRLLASSIIIFVVLFIFILLTILN